MGWFRRGQEDSLDTQYLLAQSEAASAAARARQPDPTSATGFRLTVEDVFTIAKRGTVVTGRVESGSIRQGATVRQTRPDGTVRDLQVSGIEMFRKVTEQANAGDNVGLLLRDAVSRDDIGRGDVLSA